MSAWLVLASSGCSSGGNSSVAEPEKDGDQCGYEVAGWQHSCYGDNEVYKGTSFGNMVPIISEIGFAQSWQKACCEGLAVKTTADDACESGCYEERCAGIFASYNAGSGDIEDCLSGAAFSACKPFPNASDCAWFQVSCSFISNEVFDTDGPVPLESLEEREWCGASAVGYGETGESDGETGGEGLAPTWSSYHVDLDANETLLLAEWRSRTWGSSNLSASGTGIADYRIEPCPTGGDCVYLRRLVIHGGDIEVNDIAVSNVTAQLLDPVVLPYSSGTDIAIPVESLRMLVTYRVDATGMVAAWEASNANLSSGTIDPVGDEFTIDGLNFSGSEGDIVLSLEVEVGGAHR